MGIIPAFDTGHIEADLQALTTKVNAIRSVVDGIQGYEEGTVVPLVQSVVAEVKSVNTGVDEVTEAVVTGEGEARTTAIQTLVGTVSGKQVTAMQEILANQRIITDAEIHANNIDASVGTGLGAKVDAVSKSVGSGLATAVAGVLAKVNQVLALPRERLLRVEALALDILVPNGSWSSAQQIIAANVLPEDANVVIRVLINAQPSKVVTAAYSLDGTSWSSGTFRSDVGASFVDMIVGSMRPAESLSVRFRGNPGTVTVDGVIAHFYREGASILPPWSRWGEAGAEAARLPAPPSWWAKIWRGRCRALR